MGSLAADLLALFIASSIFSLTQVRVALTPPQVELTAQQEFFAGAHLQGEAAFASADGCQLDMRWKVADNTGSRQAS